MDQWIELRRKIRNQEVSLRQLERDTGIGRQKLRKIRDNSQPPGETAPYCIAEVLARASKGEME